MGVDMGMGVDIGMGVDMGMGPVDMVGAGERGSICNNEGRGPIGCVTDLYPGLSAYRSVISGDMYGPTPNGENHML